MPSKKCLTMYGIVTLIPIIVTAIVYPSLAETIPTHFDANIEIQSQFKIAMVEAIFSSYMSLVML